MLSVPVLSDSGVEVGSVELSATIFGIEPRPDLMHQVVTAQLAARRSGTHSTKSRSEVRGGAGKPWRQKGTGRARHGTIRSPLWRGGGIAHGPKPRDYTQRTPKKMKRLALRSALSDRAASESVIVVDAWRFDAPSTSSAARKLEAVGAHGRVLLVLDRPDELARKSFRNLPRVHSLPPDQLNTFDVLRSDVMVFTQSSLEVVNGEQSVNGVPIANDPPSVNGEQTSSAEKPAPAGSQASGVEIPDEPQSVDPPDEPQSVDPPVEPQP